MQWAEGVDSTSSGGGGRLRASVSDRASGGARLSSTVQGTRDAVGKTSMASFSSSTYARAFDHPDAVATPNARLPLSPPLCAINGTLIRSFQSKETDGEDVIDVECEVHAIETVRSYFIQALHNFYIYTP